MGKHGKGVMLRPPSQPDPTAASAQAMLCAGCSRRARMINQRARTGSYQSVDGTPCAATPCKQRSARGETRDSEGAGKGCWVMAYDLLIFDS